MDREWVRMMARYNQWQHEGLTEVADGLPEEALHEDRRAFFGSIMGTMSHLLWGDHIWMSRFDGGDPPLVGIPESSKYETDWSRYKERRVETDLRILDWAENGDLGDLDGVMTWYSGAAGQEVSKPINLIYTHFFNHQTHHRGQIHKMLTEEGLKPRDTDLFFMPEF